MRKQLGSLSIDDDIYLPNDLCLLYTVPAGRQAYISSIHAFNGNTLPGKLSLWHVPAGQVLKPQYRLFVNMEIASSSMYNPSIVLYANAEDRIYVQSSMKDINFILYGEEI